MHGDPSGPGCTEDTDAIPGIPGHLADGPRKSSDRKPAGQFGLDQKSGVSDGDEHIPDRGRNWPPAQGLAPHEAVAERVRSAAGQSFSELGWVHLSCSLKELTHVT